MVGGWGRWCGRLRRLGFSFGFSPPDSGNPWRIKLKGRSAPGQDTDHFHPTRPAHLGAVVRQHRQPAAAHAARDVAVRRGGRRLDGLAGDRDGARVELRGRRRRRAWRVRRVAEALGLERQPAGLRTGLRAGVFVCCVWKGGERFGKGGGGFPSAAEGPPLLPASIPPAPPHTPHSPPRTPPDHEHPPAERTWRGSASNAARYSSAARSGSSARSAARPSSNRRSAERGGRGPPPRWATLRALCPSPLPPSAPPPAPPSPPPFHQSLRAPSKSDPQSSPLPCPSPRPPRPRKRGKGRRGLQAAAAAAAHATAGSTWLLKRLNRGKCWLASPRSTRLSAGRPACCRKCCTWRAGVAGW